MMFAQKTAARGVTAPPRQPHARPSRAVADDAADAGGSSPMAPGGSESLVEATWHGELVSIRPLCLSDVRLLYAAIEESRRQLAAWMTWCHPEYAIADTDAFVRECVDHWDSGKSYTFAIVDHTNRPFLGSIGLNRLSASENTANLGYWVRHSRAGEGVATAATRLIARFGLGALGLNRLELLVPVSNLASRRVAEKAGAKFEGVLRKRLLLECNATMPPSIPWCRVICRHLPGSNPN
jgi:ribosomal-protein-serine acetyltransferase